MDSLHKIFEQVILALPAVSVGIMILLASWAAGKALQKLLERLCKSKRIDAGLTRFLGRAAYAILLTFGIITAIAQLGVDVTALVTGLGLTGFAVGFALKDIISNALSGVLLLLYRPFHEGDTVTVTALEGAVTEINLRYTVLENDEHRIYIPNQNLFTNPVVVKKPAPPPVETETMMSMPLE